MFKQGYNNYKATTGTVIVNNFLLKINSSLER